LDFDEIEVDFIVPENNQRIHFRIFDNFYFYYFFKENLNLSLLKVKIKQNFNFDNFNDFDDFDLCYFVDFAYVKLRNYCLEKGSYLG
jgi:hypothetical protein